MLFRFHLLAHTYPHRDLLYNFIAHIPLLTPPSVPLLTLLRRCCPPPSSSGLATYEDLDETNYVEYQVSSTPYPRTHCSVNFQASVCTHASNSPLPRTAPAFLMLIDLLFVCIFRRRCVSVMFKTFFPSSYACARARACALRACICVCLRMRSHVLVYTQTMPSGKWHAAKFNEDVTQTFLREVRAFIRVFGRARLYLCTQRQGPVASGTVKYNQNIMRKFVQEVRGRAAAEGFGPTLPRAHWIGPEQ